MEERRQHRPPVRPPVQRPVHRRRPPQRRRRRRKRDFTLFFLEFLVKIAGGIKRGYLRVKATRHFRTLSAFVVVILCVSAAALIFHFATRPNALEISLDERPIGAIRLEGRREINLEYITRHATARLESQLEGRVHFVSQIAASPVRLETGAVSFTFDNLITALLNSLDFYVEGAAIIVDGTEAALLPSAAAAENLLTELADGRPLSIAFAENVDIVPRNVGRAELMTRETAHDVLTTPRAVPGTHIVQSGEVLSGIAVATGMTLSAIIANNPGIDPDNLYVGQIIFVVRTVPVLSLP